MPGRSGAAIMGGGRQSAVLALGGEWAKEATGSLGF